MREKRVCIGEREETKNEIRKWRQKWVESSLHRGRIPVPEGQEQCPHHSRQARKHVCIVFETRSLLTEDSDIPRICQWSQLSRKDCAQEPLCYLWWIPALVQAWCRQPRLSWIRTAVASGPQWLRLTRLQLWRFIILVVTCTTQTPTGSSWSLYSRLARSSHRSLCFSLPSTEISGLHHHTGLSRVFLRVKLVPCICLWMRFLQIDARGTML